jgi:hypothetical protein
MQLKVFYVKNTPVYVGDPFRVKVGYYADDGTLTDVTDHPDLQVTVLEGSSSLRSWNPPGNFQPLSATTYIVQFAFDPTPDNLRLEASLDLLTLENGDAIELDNNSENLVSTVFYFYAIPSLEFILDADEIYALLKQEEPDNVYTQAADPSSPMYCDTMGVATVYAGVYTALDGLLSSFFPETTPTGSAYLSEWEQTVTGQYNQFSPNSSRTPPLLQFLRNLNPSLNPFELAATVTEFIYLRLGRKDFVYVEEYLYSFLPGTWVLGESQLNVNTFLGKGVLPENIKRLRIHVLDGADPLPGFIHGEIEHLVSIVVRANTNWSVDYGRVPANFNLFDDLGNTYLGDPRLGGYYCLQYDPAAVENLNGLTNPYAPGKLLSIRVTPTDREVEISKLITFNCTGYYERGWSQDITTKVHWNNVTPAKFQATSTKYKFETIQLGEGQMQALYVGLSNTATLQIVNSSTDWILNVSNLNVDTVLGP